MNLNALTPDEILRIAEPKTDLEIHLMKMVDVACEEAAHAKAEWEQLSEEECGDCCEYQDQVSDLEHECAEHEDRIADLEILLDKHQIDYSEL